MIHRESIEALARSAWNPLDLFPGLSPGLSHRSLDEQRLCRPFATPYHFGRLPKTIEALLGGGSEGALPEGVVGGYRPYDTLFLLLLDGFGWRFFERYAADHPFLQRCLRQGVVSKLSSLFPSTTAVHITCLNTGLTPDQTGIYEWFNYEPAVDAIVAPLLFSLARHRSLNSLQKRGVAPEALYPFSTLYQALGAAGIVSYALQPQSAATSAYAQRLFEGATLIPCASLDQALARALTLEARAPTYVYLYWGEIDAAGHRYGIDAPEFDEKVRSTLDSCEAFYQQLATRGGRSALIVTADHGMVPVDSARTVYLDRRFPSLAQTFKKDGRGRPLGPSGSCRDCFLHLEAGRVEEVAALLSRHLEGVALVCPTAPLIDAHFFGEGSPSPRFLERIGNLLILPLAGESVWWYAYAHGGHHLRASHGGLSPEEMESLVLFLDTSGVVA